MKYAGNTEIIRKHFHDHQENLCIAVILIIPLAKQFVFKKGYLLSRELSKIFKDYVWKIQGLFKDIPQFFSFQGLFVDMIAFSRTCQGPCEQ